MRSLALAIGVTLAALLGESCTAPSAGLPSPVPMPTSLARVTVADIRANLQLYLDREVTLMGYGLTVATVPLCPGYVGLDTRTQFVDAVGDRMPAVDRLPPEVPRYDATQLRTFTATVRSFTGEMGCPGSVQLQTVTYLEVMSVR